MWQQGCRTVINREVPARYWVPTTPPGQRSHAAAGQLWALEGDYFPAALLTLGLKTCRLQRVEQTVCVPRLAWEIPYYKRELWSLSLTPGSPVMVMT